MRNLYGHNTQDHKYSLQCTLCRRRKCRLRYSRLRRQRLQNHHRLQDWLSQRLVNQQSKKMLASTYYCRRLLADSTNPKDMLIL